MSMIRLFSGGVFAGVTAEAVGGCPDKAAPDMTRGTGQTRVGANQFEARKPGVIESGSPPGIQRMAKLAVPGQLRCLVVQLGG